MSSIDHGTLAMRVLQHAAAQSRTVEDALALLRVLPQLDDVGLVTAVLWRGFPELAPPLAAAHGLLDLFRLYPLPVLFDQGETIVQRLLTASNDDGTSLAMLDWLWDQGLAFDPPVADMHQRFAKWMHIPVRIPPAIHTWATAKGIVLDRALRAPDPLIEALHVSDVSAATAVYDQMISARSSFRFTGRLVKQAIHDASVRGDVRVLGWWWARANVQRWDPTTHATMALASGHPELLAWWWQRYLELRDNNTNSTVGFTATDGISAAVSGVSSLTSVQWLWDMSHAHPADFACDWDAVFVHGIAVFSSTRPFDLEVLEWWYARIQERGIKPKWPRARCTQCVQYEQLDVLSWLWDRRDAIAIDWDPYMIRFAFWSANLSVLQWLWDRRTELGDLPQLNPNWKIDYRKTAAEKLAVYQWWESRTGERIPNSALSECGRWFFFGYHLPAVAWWLAKLDGVDCGQAETAVGDVLDHVQSPVALDVLAEYAGRRGIYFAGLKSRSTQDRTVQLWWSAYLSQPQ